MKIDSHKDINVIMKTAYPNSFESALIVSIESLYCIRTVPKGFGALLFPVTGSKAGQGPGYT